RRPGGAMSRRISAPVLLATCWWIGLVSPIVPAHAGYQVVPPQWRISPPIPIDGSGLRVRFKDLTPTERVDTNDEAAAVVETVTVAVAVLPGVNFKLNTGSTFGPWNHGGSDFAAHYDGYLNVREAGLYQFALSADDGARFRIAGVTFLLLDGLNWNPTI